MTNKRPATFFSIFLFSYLNVLLLLKKSFMRIFDLLLMGLGILLEVCGEVQVHAPTFLGMCM